MNRRIYAGEISKDYLKKLGIEYVSTDGKVVVKNGKIAKININKKAKRPYGVVSLYDPDIRAAIPVEERAATSGQFTLGIHVINYVWNTGITKPEGMVIDHIDNDPLNNNISNLQMITQCENVSKGRTNWRTYQLKCKMNKPRSFYEEKLRKYTEMLEQAKRDHDEDACHKLRTNKSQTEARLRYWDAHRAEYEEHADQAISTSIDAANKKQSVSDRKLLKQFKDEARTSGNLRKWHYLNSVIKNWDKYDAVVKHNIMSVLLGKVNNVI